RQRPHSITEAGGAKGVRIRSPQTAHRTPPMGWIRAMHSAQTGSLERVTRGVLQRRQSEGSSAANRLSDKYRAAETREGIMLPRRDSVPVAASRIEAPLLLK